MYSQQRHRNRHQIYYIDSIVSADVNEKATDYEIDQHLQTEMTDDEAIDLILKEAEITDDEPNEMELEANDNLLSEFQSDMRNTHGMNVIWSVTGVNCIAHTLQLVVGDAISTLPKANANIITLCRRCAKHMRLQSTERNLKKDGIVYKRPRLDVKTRWGSLYQMVIFHYSIMLRIRCAKHFYFIIVDFYSIRCWMCSTVKKQCIT